MRLSFRKLPLHMKAASIGATMAAAIVCLFVGSALASAYQTLSGKVELASANVLVTPTESVSSPARLKVEIVRNGKTLCAGEGEPEAKTKGYSTDYSLEDPVTASCPPLRVGDTVRATWIQSSKVNISSR